MRFFRSSLTKWKSSNFINIIAKEPEPFQKDLARIRSGHGVTITVPALPVKAQKGKGSKAPAPKSEDDDGEEEPPKKKKGPAKQVAFIKQDEDELQGGDEQSPLVAAIAGILRDFTSNFTRSYPAAMAAPTPPSAASQCHQQAAPPAIRASEVEEGTSEVVGGKVQAHRTAGTHHPNIVAECTGRELQRRPMEPPNKHSSVLQLHPSCTPKRVNTNQTRASFCAGPPSQPAAGALATMTVYVIATHAQERMVPPLTTCGIGARRWGRESVSPFSVRTAAQNHIGREGAGILESGQSKKKN